MSPNQQGLEPAEYAYRRNVAGGATIKDRQMIPNFLLPPQSRTFRRTATLAAVLSLAGTILLFSQQYIHCFPAPKLFAQTVPLAFAVAAAAAAGLKAPAPFFPLLVVLGWTVASFVRAQSPEAFSLSFLPLLSAAVMFLLAKQLGPYPAERRRLLAAFILAHLGCAIYGIAQYFALDPFTWSVDYGTGRAFSTIGNPNFFAGQMVLAIPMLLAASASRDRLIKIPAQSAAVAAFGAFIVAQTRGAMIGLAVGLGIGAILYWLRRDYLPKPGRVLLFPLAGIVLISIYFSLPALNRTGVSLPGQLISSLDLEQASARQRFFWWKGAALLLRGRPLVGVGLGNFPREFPKAAKEIVPLFPDLRPAFCDHPHNDYLYILCEHGILGFGLLLWLAVACVRGLAAFQTGEHGLMNVAALAGLAGISIHAIWNMPFVIPSTLISAALLAGLAFARAAPPSERGHEPRSPGRLSAWIRGGLILGIGVAFCFRSGTILVATHYLNGARVMKEQNAFGPAAYFVRQSLKLTQAPWRQHFMLGSILYGQHYYRESLNAFRLDEAENPWGADAILHQGKALRQMGLYDQAEKECRRALKLVPNYTAAAVTIAVLDYYRARDAHEKGNKTEKARRLQRADVWLEYALRFFPNDAEALKVRGYVAIMAGRWEQALVYWEHYIEAAPKDALMRQRIASLKSDLPRLKLGKATQTWSGAGQAQQDQ